MNFQHDLRIIAEEALKKMGVIPDQNWSDHKTCAKFYDIKKRFFPSYRKYKLEYSNEINKQIPNLPPESLQALNDICQRLENQISITPYLSDRIKTTSMKKSDLLLKVWNIYHAHLDELQS